MSLRTEIIGTIALLACFSVPAFAEPGEGLQAGKLSLSPGITLTSSFDSNVFFTADDEDGLGAPSLRVMPFLQMSTIEPDVVDFTLLGSVAWEQYISSSSIEIREQSGLEADLTLGVGFNRNGSVSFALEDAFTRTNEPPYEVSTASFDRTHNRAGATFGVHPGGRVFQHYLSYDWNLYFHDTIPDLNKQIHDFTLKNYWKFLPRTAIMLAGDLALVRYAEPFRNRGGNAFPNVNSMPLRITGGINGLFTNRLSIRLFGGWGFGFYESGASFSGVLVDSRVTYAIGSTAEESSVYVGYERSFNDATIASFTTHHRPYIGYEQGIADRRLRLNARAELLLRNYVSVPAGLYTVPAGQLSVPAELSDSLLKLKAGASFDITKFFNTSVSYTLSSNFTDDVVSGSGTAGDALRQYIRHYVGLGITFKY